MFDRVRRSRPGMIDRDLFDWDMRSDVRRYPEGKPWHGFRLLCVDDAGDGAGLRPLHGQGPLVRHAAAEHGSRSPSWPRRRRPPRPGCGPTCCRSTSSGRSRRRDRPLDDVLPWLLVDGRHAKQTSCFDMLWLRPLDVPRLLTARAYDASGRVVLEVDDPLGLAGGRFALDASPAGATCTTTTESAELTLPIRTLGAACLGDVRLDVLHRAGWLDEHVARRRRAGRRAARRRRRAVVQHLVLMDRGLRRIAIVNRGEAAMRLINAVRELRVERNEDIRTIALHTAAERTAMFVREADEAVLLDGTYLDLAALERALSAARADAAWVGWGFVAERPEFAELCDRLGITFVGPSAEVMRRLGDKIGAKRLAEEAAVPGGGVERRPGRDAGGGPPARRGDRLPADDQGHRRRRRARHPARRRSPTGCRRRSRAPAPRAARRSATPPCSWSASSPAPATSRSS